MATYSYFKLTNIGVGGVAPNTTATALAYSEIQFRTTAGSASSKVVPINATASSTFTSIPGYDITKSYDGDSSTLYSSNGSSDIYVITYQLPSAITLAEIMIQARPDGNYNQGPTSFTVSGSNDGTNYTAIGTCTFAVWTSPGQIQTSFLAGVPLSITGTAPQGTVGSVYNFAFTVQGGSGTKTYSLSGTLPTGLTYSTSTGVISGTPTTTVNATGLVMSVTDSSGNANTGSFTINVVAAGTSFLYYRIDLIEVNGVLNNTLLPNSFCEIEFRTSSGVPSSKVIPTYATAISTFGEVEGPYDLQNTYDGNTSTLYAADGVGSAGFLIYKFASPISIQSIAITSRNDSNYNNAPTKFRILGLDTQGAISGKLIGSVTFPTWTAALQTQEATINTAGAGVVTPTGRVPRFPLPTKLLFGVFNVGKDRLQQAVIDGWDFVYYQQVDFNGGSFFFADEWNKERKRVGMKTKLIPGFSYGDTFAQPAGRKFDYTGALDYLFKDTTTGNYVDDPTIIAFAHYDEPGTPATTGPNNQYGYPRETPAEIDDVAAQWDAWCDAHGIPRRIKDCNFLHQEYMSENERGYLNADSVDSLSSDFYPIAQYGNRTIGYNGSGKPFYGTYQGLSVFGATVRANWGSGQYSAPVKSYGKPYGTYVQTGIEAGSNGTINPPVPRPDENDTIVWDSLGNGSSEMIGFQTVPGGETYNLHPQLLKWKTNFLSNVNGLQTRGQLFRAAGGRTRFDYRHSAFPTTGDSTTIGGQQDFGAIFQAPNGNQMQGGFTSFKFWNEAETTYTLVIVNLTGDARVLSDTRLNITNMSFAAYQVKAFAHTDTTYSNQLFTYTDFNPAQLTITTTSLPVATPGQPYSFTIDVAGGYSQPEFTITNLPSWLTPGDRTQLLDNTYSGIVPSNFTSANGLVITAKDRSYNTPNSTGIATTAPLTLATVAANTFWTLGHDICNFIGEFQSSTLSITSIGIANTANGTVTIGDYARAKPNNLGLTKGTLSPNVGQFIVTTVVETNPTANNSPKTSIIAIPATS